MAQQGYTHEQVEAVRGVVIPARAEHEGIYCRTVALIWRCPVCGAPRGEVFEAISFDGSRRLHVDGWVNPCGHVDKYPDVRAEAAANGLNNTSAASADQLRPKSDEGSPTVTVGQRVAVELDGEQRVGTVKELHAGSGTVRVEVDLATMHEWVRPAALTPLPEPLALGTVVRLPGGAEGIVCAHSSETARRCEVVWFDRHYWAVRRRWFAVSRLTVLGSIKQTTAAA